jgi:hypothetical protein
VVTWHTSGRLKKSGRDQMTYVRVVVLRASRAPELVRSTVFGPCGAFSVPGRSWSVPEQEEAP